MSPNVALWGIHIGCETAVTSSTEWSPLIHQGMIAGPPSRTDSGSLGTQCSAYSLHVDYYWSCSVERSTIHIRLTVEIRTI